MLKDFCADNRDLLTALILARRSKSDSSFHEAIVRLASRLHSITMHGAASPAGCKAADVCIANSSMSIRVHLLAIYAVLTEGLTSSTETMSSAILRCSRPMAGSIVQLRVTNLLMLRALLRKRRSKSTAEALQHFLNAANIHRSSVTRMAESKV